MKTVKKQIVKSRKSAVKIEVKSKIKKQVRSLIKKEQPKKEKEVPTLIQVGEKMVLNLHDSQSLIFLITEKLNKIKGGLELNISINQNIEEDFCLSYANQADNVESLKLQLAQINQHLSTII